MPKLSKATEQRIKHLEAMAERYRKAGNELAASRCEAQIRQIEAQADR